MSNETPELPNLFDVKFCDVPGCGRQHFAGGYCNQHHRRLQKFGDVLADKPVRFKPMIPSGTFRLRPDGHIQVKTTEGKWVSAYRHAYEQANRVTVPKTRQVLRVGDELVMTSGMRIYICERCRQHFSASGTALRRFCSRECYLLSAVKNAIGSCPQCGEGFLFKPSNPKTFCSFECFVTWERVRHGKLASNNQAARSVDLWKRKSRLGDR